MRARESGSASGFSTTVASVKSTVLFIGQRSLYGVPNTDADILEDETESCLWCWEEEEEDVDDEREVVHNSGSPPVQAIDGDENDDG
ncbi:Chromatin assembly factor 1 subunit FSM [Camellia lanceoleosa]|uniref:Chromatin assembly factor 1 subunit FSM n=1 Tax=Camellia lanceoleosa TaxID=1840588 RepID=A0ACC0H6E3_9ERIC|nr:Chromatin assembly factor 1 subunit FSM [Camellia lanceoleosa]